VSPARSWILTGKAGRPVLLALLALSAAGQQRDSNPYSTPEHVAEGRRLYRFYCVNCHGMDGASGRGARLATTFRRHGSSDADMFRTVSNGIPGTEMPGLWMDEESVWKILAFVRTLEARGVDACDSNPDAAKRGWAVYRNKGGCAACHTMRAGGGRLGPDLTAIGAGRSREQLHDAIVAPDRQIPKRYRTVVASGANGSRHEGILLNEDEYTLHLMDRTDRIRSFQKRELSSIERPSRSLMPSYAQSLSASEIEDLLSYLCAEKEVKP